MVLEGESTIREKLNVLTVYSWISEDKSRVLIDSLPFYEGFGSDQECQHVI